ncbi:MAG: phosphoribosylaminoimidazolesuccinocarboxamide synthase [Alphaproteobacteria bacterium]|nr:phosphoribosylaminoimidazolesuccinocarboxamide synthase [Alphaproteobacteria bacterium]
MARKTPLYEGKAKQLFEGPEPGTLIQHFKDDATAFNNKKKGTISGKGVLNNRISEFIMLRLEEIGVPTHFLRTLNMREQLIRAAEIIPIEVIVRNYSAGGFAERFGVEEGLPLPRPIIEFCLKSDSLGDPLISEDVIFAFEWADPMEIDEIRLLAYRINDYLSGLFRGAGLQLVDFKMEFGRVYDEEGYEGIVLADEISPDSCRLWDTRTGEKLDKDRFRRDMGKVEEAYQEVARRLGVLSGEGEFSPLEESKTNKATPKPKTSTARGEVSGKKPQKSKPAPKKK